MMQQQKVYTVTFDTFLLDPKPGVENVIESIQPPADSDIKYPSEGLNVLYGRRYAAESMTQFARQAKAQGKTMVPVSIRMTAWRTRDSSHWFDTYEGKTVFDMRRLAEDVSHILFALWKKYLTEDLKAEGYTGESLRKRLEQIIRDEEKWGHQRNYLDARPHYIDRLRKEPGFENVDAFIWMLTEQGKQVVRATLYNARNVTLVTTVSRNIKAVLPDWLQR